VGKVLSCGLKPRDDVDIGALRSSSLASREGSRRFDSNSIPLRKIGKVLPSALSPSHALVWLRVGLDSTTLSVSAQFDVRETFFRVRRTPQPASKEREGSVYFPFVAAKVRLKGPPLSREMAFEASSSSLGRPLGR